MKNFLIKKALAVLGAAVFAGASLGAGAATTVVNAQGGGGGSERCLVSSGVTCSGGTYNGALSMISVFEKDLGLAAGSIVRVDDNLDKIWTNTVNNGGQVQALARYAGDNSKLGYDGGSGFTYLTGPLANNKVRVNSAAAYAGDTKPGDFMIAADSWIGISLAAGVPFAFVLKDISMNYMISSNTGSGVASTGYENSDNLNLDYMVTFLVPDVMPHYIIAWEDRNPKIGNTGDYDYNDFVAEVRFANPVPEPEIYAMLAAGLGLLGWARRRREARNS